MGYTKKWTPPVIPLPDDLSVWKALFQDLHDNLLAAGLVQTGTAGQLDIQSVTTLPGNGAYAGFIEYALADALQATAPVIIKLEFGCGVEGLWDYVSGPGDRNARRGGTPFVRCTVRFKGTLSKVFSYPQTYVNPASNFSNTAVPTTVGLSAICNNPERGFFGVAYGVGSRNKPYRSDTGGGGKGSYYGSTFTLFLQRSTDAQGTPTDQGLAIYYTGLDTGYNPYNPIADNSWLSHIYHPAYSEYIADGFSYKSRDLAARRCGNIGAETASMTLLQPIFYSDGVQAYPHGCIFSYKHTVASGSTLAPGTEFDVAGSSPAHLIALGNETSLTVDAVVGSNAGIAMLFE